MFARASTANNRRRLSRWRQGVAALVCFAFGALVQAPTQAQSADLGSVQMAGQTSIEGINPALQHDYAEQLGQLKQAFMNLAMDQEARIAASSWTDSNGTMGEDVMVFSGLKLEKLRPVLRRNRFGAETTDLLYATDTSAAACATQPLRPQRLGLTVEVEAGGKPGAQNMARAAAHTLSNALQTALAEGRLGNVSVLLDHARSDTSNLSTYERFMTAAAVSYEDLHLYVHVTAGERRPLLQRAGIFAHARPSKTLAVELRLMARQVEVLSLATQLPIPSSRVSNNNQLAWLTLPESALLGLNTWLDTVLIEVAAAVHCHGESALTLIADASQITLQGGQDAGLYQGQRLAILPSSQRLRSRGLQHSLSVVGLAQVTRVGPRSATLTMYAGPSAGDITDMMAIPVAALAP